MCIMDQKVKIQVIELKQHYTNQLSLILMVFVMVMQYLEAVKQFDAIGIHYGDIETQFNVVQTRYVCVEIEYYDIYITDNCTTVWYNITVKNNNIWTGLFYGKLILK
eukprot:172520_1